MGLRETIQNATGSAIAALGNVAVSTNYRAFVSTTYNASTGVATTTYTTTAGVSVVFDAFRLEQIDGEKVKPEDKIALVAQVQISGTTPNDNDQITEGTKTWNVVKVGVDPAGALWSLQIRRP